MEGWLFVLTNVAVAGAVGGVTNHIAIKMLFHPRRPLVLFGWKVPFTPGLIPKRKQEIAAALGDVVADYLVTPEGFQELLGKEQFRRSVAEQAARWLEREFGKTVTVGDWMRRLFGEERAGRWAANFPVQAGERAGSIFAAWWRRGDWERKRICEAVPGWSGSAVEGWASALSAWGLQAVKAQLLAPEGQAMLRKLAAGLMERAGGFVGMLAGIFVDEDKLVARLTPLLAEQLDRPVVRLGVAEVVARRLNEWGDQTVGEVLRTVAKDEPPLEYAQRWIREKLPWQEWADRIERFPVGEWLIARKDEWHPRLVRAVDHVLDGVSRHVRVLISSIRLQDMVRNQVERFPVEKLEQVILNVTGREFKAITWLGVVLGGFIGLMQSLFLLFWK